MSKIAILGAGYTGLSAATKLIKNGYEVDVFEIQEFAGGLASGTKYEGFDSLLKYVFQNFIYRNPDEKNASENYLFNYYIKEYKNLNNFKLNNESKNIFNSTILNNNNLIKTKLKKLLKIG